MRCTACGGTGWHEVNGPGHAVAPLGGIELRTHPWIPDGALYCHPNLLDTGRLAAALAEAQAVVLKMQQEAGHA